MLLFLFLIAAFVAELAHGTAAGSAAPLAGEASGIVILGLILSAALGWAALRYAPAAPEAFRKSLVMPTIAAYGLAIALYVAFRIFHQVA